MTTLPYLDFTVRLRPDGRGGAAAIVVHSAAGGGGASSPELPLAPNELHRIVGALARGVRDPETPAPTGPPTIEELMERPTAAGLGRLLSAQFFQGRVRDAFLKSRVLAAAGGHPGLRLRLLFDLEDAEGEGEEAAAFRRQALALAALPWELIYDPEADRPLARGDDCPVVRVLAARAEAPRPRIEAPFRVLLAAASPRSLPPIDVERELAPLRAALGTAPIEVDLLEHAQLDGLRAAAAGRAVHAVHFLGHGDLDHGGDGVLAFEGADDEGTRVAGRLLAETLRGLPSLRLVTLMACRSAGFLRRDGLDPYSGVAHALIASGVPAVVAMQLPITTAAAGAFAAGFYAALAVGESPENASVAGRRAVREADPASREWAIPALFLPLGGEPVLAGLASIVRVPEELRAEIRTETTYIEDKTAGFVGRGFVRDEVERFLRRESRGYFFLLGEPGIGKTAFVTDLVRGRRCPHHFNRRDAGVIQTGTFLRNLCAQLIVERRLGHRSLPPRAGRDSGFLDELLHQAAAGLAPHEKLLIAVDALDESDADSLPPGVNPLCLPSHLPAGVVFLISSRHRDDRRSPLPNVDAPWTLFVLGQGSKENLVDVRELVGNHLGLRGIQDYLREQSLTEDGFVEAMVERSEGNFMYLHHVLPAIARGELRSDAPPQIPKGLAGYYEKHWERMRLPDEETWFDLALPVLHLITVAELPLSAELVARCLGGPSLARVRAVLRGWRPFLHCAEAVEESGEPVRQYSLYHTSFREFIERQDEVRDQGPSLADARERLFLYLEGTADDGAE